MIQRQIGSILFVAGTTIGSGIMALPVIIAKLGLIPGTALMLTIWALMYYTALVSIELNLQAGTGQPLGTLGKLFSGRTASIIGSASYTLLSYALMSVFIYGGASIIHKYFLEATPYHLGFNAIASICTLLAVLLLIGPIRYIDIINRVFFSTKCVVMAILIFSLGKSIQYNELPLLTDNISHASAWIIVVPVIFTSFGFQVIFHSMADYCHHNAAMLKRAFFWGSLIPAIIYIVWTTAVLATLHQSSPDFYQLAINGKADIGDIINELSKIHSGTSVALLFWWISCLSVVTSIIGVGLGLVDAWKKRLHHTLTHRGARHLIAVIATLLPAYLIAIIVPNAFIKVLGFAGMILVIIAVLLPLYLLHQAQITTLVYGELNSKWLKTICILGGIAVMGCEILNIL